MKIVHTSDLHLGKRVHGFQMNADQEHILGSMLEIIREEQADALVIAGDVYDRSVPPEEAVGMFGRFLNDVVDSGCQVFIIAGNHDSGRRLDFCGDILGRSGVHICGEFTGRAEKVTLEDRFGELDVYMLPYVKPSIVREACGCDVADEDSAVRYVLDSSNIDYSRRTLLIAHQFVIGGGRDLETSESEISRPEVGGIDSVSASILDGFDYVALGHLHIPQSVGRDTMRYSGSPLKYSASEALRDKSVTVVEMRVKGSVDVRTVPLVPERDLRVISGTVDELVRAGRESVPNDDYYVAKVTGPASDAASRLREVYPNLMAVTFEERRQRLHTGGIDVGAIPRRSVAEMFGEFYERMTGEKLTDYQAGIVESSADRGGDAE